MSDRPVIRLFRFRPARVEFDKTLRTIMVPDLRRIEGLIDVHVGRHGSEQLGDRVVATIWTDRAAMNAGMGPSLAESTFHTDRLSETTDHQFEAHELDLMLRFPGGPPSTLLRLFRGQVKPGELAAYIEEARAGTLADVEAERGPAALYLAADPPDRFLTAVAVAGLGGDRAGDRRRRAPADGDQGLGADRRHGHRPLRGRDGRDLSGGRATRL